MPTVFAASRGVAPSAVMQDWHQELRPLPCPLLTVFHLQGWSAVKGLLQLRELFVGSGSPLSPGRFLFEAVGQVHLMKWTPEGGSRVVPLDATEIEQELSYFAAPKPAGSNGDGQQQQQPARAGGAAATPGMQLEQQVQEASGMAAAPAAAAGGAAAALMNSVRAWLDHHHRSYAQELEAAALRGVREQLAAEQRQQQSQTPQVQQQQPQGV